MPNNTFLKLVEQCYSSLGIM